MSAWLSGRRCQYLIWKLVKRIQLFMGGKRFSLHSGLRGGAMGGVVESFETARSELICARQIDDLKAGK